MKLGWLILGALFIISILTVNAMYNHGDEIVERDEVMYMVSHSEYWSGEEGQIIARLYDWRGDPITVDNCTTDVYYPDKSAFITGGLTDDSLQATTGTHYYNFTTPATEGVYQYLVTCSYNSKVRSVANSFHLSPALNFLINVNDSVTALTAQELAHYISVSDNLTNIRVELGVVDANVDQLVLDVLGMNSTINNIDGNVDQVLLDLLQVNGTVNSIETKVDTISGDVTSILVNLTTIDGNVDTLLVDLAVVDANVDQVLLDLLGMNVTLNTVDTNVDQLLLDVADVQTDTTFIRDNMFTTDNVTLISTELSDEFANVQNNLTSIQQFCDSAETSGSQLCLWVSAINTNVLDINATSNQYSVILNEINQTTHSTYDYMTGTLATNVNTLLGTTSRIETNTIQINDTVNTISTNVDTALTNISTVITNQEEQVYMEVTS